MVSTERTRSGRLMTVDWQNRHCQGQPRMISMAMRSCGVSTNGTIGPRRQRDGVEILLIVQAMISRGTSRAGAVHRGDGAVGVVLRLVERGA